MFSMWPRVFILVSRLSKTLEKYLFMDLQTFNTFDWFFKVFCRVIYEIYQKTRKIEEKKGWKLFSTFFPQKMFNALEGVHSDSQVRNDTRKVHFNWSTNFSTHLNSFYKLILEMGYKNLSKRIYIKSQLINIRNEIQPFLCPISRMSL